jgi:hypothetical protein
VTDTDDTGDIQAGALFTSDLSSDYLSLLPDLHHMFVGLTQTKADRIVMMASAEIYPVDLAAATQQAEPTVCFTATDESHPPPKAGNNDVAVPSRTQQVTKTMLPARNAKLLKPSPQPQTPNDTRQLTLHRTHPIVPPREPIMTLQATTTMLPN